MKALPCRLVHGKGYEPCSVEEATHLTLVFPGPVDRLTLPVTLHGKREGTPNWSWNGDAEKPTLHPSVLTKFGRGGAQICHSFVNDGKVRFLDDCTHELKGQTVDLLDV